MSDVNGALVHKEPFKYKVKRALGVFLFNRLINKINAWLVSHRFKQAYNSNYIHHAKRELEFAGYDLEQKEEDPNKWICKNIIELLSVFSNQGHSGFSAPYCISMFEKLARFEPLTPLTGEDEEWNHICSESDTYQNKRCGTVFKKGKDGIAYWLDGKIFREPDGCTFTSKDSCVDIEFPWVKPEPEIIDVEKQD